MTLRGSTARRTSKIVIHSKKIKKTINSLSTNSSANSSANSSTNSARTHIPKAFSTRHFRISTSNCRSRTMSLLQVLLSTTSLLASGGVLPLGGADAGILQMEIHRHGISSRDRNTDTHNSNSNSRDSNSNTHNSNSNSRDSNLNQLRSDSTILDSNSDSTNSDTNSNSDNSLSAIQIATDSNAATVNSNLNSNLRNSREKMGKYTISPGHVSKDGVTQNS
jgi:hypothetical protein